MRKTHYGLRLFYTNIAHSQEGIPKILISSLAPLCGLQLRRAFLYLKKGYAGMLGLAQNCNFGKVNGLRGAQLKS